MPQPKYLAMYLVALVLIVAVVSSIPGLTRSYLTQQDVEARLLVGTNVWPGYEPLFLAQDLGILPKEKVRLVEYSSSTQVARALSNSVVDAAALTLDEALRVAGLGVKIDVVLVLDVSAGGDMILARPEFSTFESLKGKRVGAESTALGAFILQRALTIHGMTRDDLVIVSLEVDEHEEAIRENTIDAVITFNPIASRLKLDGLVEIFSSNDIPGEIVDVLVVRSDVLDQHTRVLVELVDAWFETLDYIDANPAEAYSSMAPRLNTDAETVADSLNLLHFPNRQENATFLVPRGGLHQAIEKTLPVLRNFDGVSTDDVNYEIGNSILLERAAY